MNRISSTALRAKWAGKDRTLTDGGGRGAGRLIAIQRRKETVFFYRHFDSRGRKPRILIGPFDPTGRRGVTLQKARDKAAELSSLYRSGVRDLHQHFETLRREKEEAEARALEEANRGDLRGLLTAYTRHLEMSGKGWREPTNLFTRNILHGAPELASRRANDIGVDAFVRLIGKLVEAKKGRTAAKLRGYLRAAYSLAIRAKTDPSAPMTMRTFGIDQNPIASIGALSQFNRTRDRTLSAEELSAFLKRLDVIEAAAEPNAKPNAKVDAVRLGILLGGQRPTQLLRVRPVDIDLAAGTILLLDPKGRRTEPRRHVLPLTKKALAILDRRLEKLGKDEPLFSTDGETALRPETLSVFVADIATAMMKADPPEAREDFDLRDLRRTCETMLAALGVSSDIRAQLQSHGLAGVQNRSYNRHEYALEKREALGKWSRHLDRIKAGNKAKVIPMRRTKTNA